MFDRFITHTARISPQSTAMISFDGEISYSRLDADINRVAAALLKEFDPLPKVVAISYQQLHPHWLFILALCRIGVASASVSDDAFVAESEIKILQPDLVISDEMFDIVDGPKILVLDSDWVRNVLKGPAVDPIRPPEDPDRLARVAISSGTSAEKHRIDFSCRLIESNLLRGVQLESVSWIDLSPARVVPRILPTLGFGSIHGFLSILVIWLVRGSIVIADREQYPAALIMLRPTVMIVSPIQLQEIMSRMPKEFQPSENLRLIVSAGIFPKALREDVVARLTPFIRVNYTTSESGILAAIPVTQHDHDDMAGWVLPWADIQIVDEHDQVLPFNTIGEIRVKSAEQVSGFYKNEAATKAQFKNGWFYTGDLGILDASGLLRLRGRIDGLFNFGGDKFDSARVSTVIKAVPGVIDAALFSVDNINGLAEPWLAIVQGEGYDNDKVSRAIEENFPNLPNVMALWIDRIPRNDQDQVYYSVLSDIVYKQFKNYKPRKKDLV